MKYLVVAFSMLAPAAAHAQYGGYGTGSYGSPVQHQGYTTQRGTFVEPHYQTAPNESRMDNYSTRGNVNPYTGKPGYESPFGN